MKNKKFSMIASVLVLSALSFSCLAGCSNEEEPYTFTNPPKVVAEADADMTFDGEFNEARWSKVRWIEARDKYSEQQYADIRFTTSYGEKGIYFAMQVEETGTNIYVNHARDSFNNSGIEMYMGPIEDGGDSIRCFEFDFMADGSYSSKINFNGWNGANTIDEHMPVVATKQLGGEVNTEECYGYAIEAFFPWGFLEFAGYDLSDKENMVLGINPVHIFSFSYTGNDKDTDRCWSQWASQYIPVGWIDPSSYFQFGKDGLIAFGYTVKTGGTGKGVLQEQHGWDYVLGQADAVFVVQPINGAVVSKLTVNGVDYRDKLVYAGGKATFRVEKANLNGDLEIEVDFSKP